MNIIELVGSVNKLSLLVLSIVISFLLYELYVFRKEKKRKATIAMPSFRPQTVAAPAPTTTPVPPPMAAQTKPAFKITKPRRKVNKKIIGMLVGTLVMIGGVSIISFRLSQPPTQGNNLAPAAPRAQAITPAATNSAQLSPTSGISPTLIAQNQQPTQPVPTATLIPTSPPPTSTPAPTLAPPTATPVVTITQAVSPTGVVALPKSGLPQFSFLLFGVAVALIFFSFLY